MPEIERASRKNSEVSEGEKSSNSKNKGSTANQANEVDTNTSNILETDNSIHSDNERINYQVQNDEGTSLHENQSERDVEGDKMLT